MFNIKFSLRSTPFYDVSSTQRISSCWSIKMSHIGAIPIGFKQAVKKFLSQNWIYLSVIYYWFCSLKYGKTTMFWINNESNDVPLSQMNIIHACDRQLPSLKPTMASVCPSFKLVIICSNCYGMFPTNTVTCPKETCILMYSHAPL